MHMKRETIKMIRPMLAIISTTEMPNWNVGENSVKSCTANCKITHMQNSRKNS